VAVVHLGDLDVPIVPEPRRRLAHQMARRLMPSDMLAACSTGDGRRGGVDRRLF
jgi:hypothetical protein